MTFADARHLSAYLRARAPALVVGMPMRDMGRSAARAVSSVLGQRGVRGRLTLVVLDDGSTDGGPATLAHFSRDPRLLVVRGRWGSAWAVRNALLDAAAETPGCGLVLRLDADDVMDDPCVVAAIERRFTATVSYPGRGRRAEPTALLGGNALAADGRTLGRVNVPDHRLATAVGLGDRLAGMAAGDPLAELPSCNLVLRADASWRYPSLPSAEDHWLTAAVLSSASGRVEIFDDRPYCTYSLTGALTQHNRARARHLAARQRLYELWCHRASSRRSRPC